MILSVPWDLKFFSGNEITSELYAFDKLNFPPNHPARESMDTYWLEGHDSGSTNEKLCLRPPSHWRECPLYADTQAALPFCISRPRIPQ